MEPQGSILVWKIDDLLAKAAGAGFMIVLFWIPAHAGIRGNEVADSWTRSAFSEFQIADWFGPTGCGELYQGGL